MISAMKFVYQRMKLAIEVSAGAGVAAACSPAFKETARRLGLNNVGIILCGGNTDLDRLPWL